MGCSNSKELETPSSPLQEFQFEEAKRRQRKRKERKVQRKIAKLQRKHAKKRRQHQRRSNDNTDSASETTAAAAVEPPIAPTPGDNDSIYVGKTMPLNVGMQKFRQRISNDANASGIGVLASEDLQRFEHMHEKHKRLVEQRTRLQLENELCTFLLNQLVFNMQFFGHCENELTSTYDEWLAKENLYNQQLSEHSILLVNPLDAAVSKRLAYKPVHGPNKQYAQPLQAQLMYVVFENIDIARPNDANYDSISPLCKVLIETEYYRTTPCRLMYVNMMREIKWKGFVRLKLREDAKVHRTVSGNDVYTDSSSGYSTTSGYYSSESGNVEARTLSRASSVYASGEESDYDYVYIAKLNAHHPITELKMSNQRARVLLESKVLPESCISKLSSFIEPCLEDSDDEDTEDEDDVQDEHEDEVVDKPNDEKTDNQSKTQQQTAESPDGLQDYETVQVLRQCQAEQTRRCQLLQQRYLNSKQFMHYFGDLLRHKLAAQLHISKSELDASTYRGCSIYTPVNEIVPAIHVAQCWPDCAFQFRIRERPVSTNPLTGQQIQWPTRAMIKHIESFGFHVVPMGYAPKRQRNPFRELEWRIAFPKAERYLERHLSNAQIKVFMLMKALVKSFVEPHEKRHTLMFAVEHLRAHLFWECERDYNAWPEEFLGEALLRFISSFMTCLRKKHLSDYFIEERNLFENIPEDALVTLHSIMADIAEYPLMHLMVALRNLDHQPDFYPKMNYKKLFENIMEHDIIKLKQHSKYARHSLANDTSSAEHAARDENDALEIGARGLLGMQQERAASKHKLRKKTQLMRHNIAQQQAEQQQRRRQSVDSIEAELLVTKNARSPQMEQHNAGIENLRRTNLLEILLDHLMLLIAKANVMRNATLAKLYTAHARRLCKYYHNLGCDQNARTYLDAIVSVEQQQSSKLISYDPVLPALPRRCSAETNIIKEEARQTAEQTPVSSSTIDYKEHIMEVHVNVSETTTFTKNAQQITTCTQFDNALQSTDQSNTDETIVQPTLSGRLLRRLNDATGAITGDCNLMQTLSAKTEQVIHTLAPEEKCLELRQILKRHTLQLKDVFINQSSET